METCIKVASFNIAGFPFSKAHIAGGTAGSWWPTSSEIGAGDHRSTGIASHNAGGSG